MTIPTIHKNGTSKDELVEQLCNSVHALSIAIDTMRAGAPNGRDYYPQGIDAIAKAAEEFTDRINRVRAVQMELEKMALAICDI